MVRKKRKLRTTLIRTIKKGRLVHNTKSKKADSRKKALPAGLRRTAYGSEYYENRTNRSDARGSRL